MQTPVVPFFIDQVYQGFATARGLASMTADGLTLEFEVKDAVVGVLRTGPRQVHIQIDQLGSVELITGWFTTRLRIRTRTMAALSALPGDHTDCIQLGVKRQDREKAQALASAIALRLSQRRLEELGRGPDAVT